jgi:hypothetical protein
MLRDNTAIWIGVKRKKEKKAGYFWFNPRSALFL